MTGPAKMQYDFTSLKNATATFCAGLLVANNSAILQDLLSPDCKVSNHKETKRGSEECMQSLFDLQSIILKFEAENCPLRRGVKINEKEEKTRLLLMPMNGTMPFRLGLILHWECGILIHVSIVEDPWQGFLDELSASEANRKLNQQSTNSLKKSVSAAHHSWRRISDVVVDAYLINIENDDEDEKEEGKGATDDGAGQTIVKLCHDTSSNTEGLETSESNSTIDEKAVHREEQSHVENTQTRKHSVPSSDENIFHSASFIDDIEIDFDQSGLADQLNCEKTGNEDTRRIRFDTTVNALLIAERCELTSNNDLFYSSKELKSFQADLNDELLVVQREHRVKSEVAMKIYFCTSPDEIEEIKSKNENKKTPYRKSLTHINNTANQSEGGGDKEGGNHSWYHHLPVPRLVRALKHKQKKKKNAGGNRKTSKTHSGPPSLTDLRSSSSLHDIEGHISEIRASSFGSSLRGRDPEATKLVLTVRVLCCVNLQSRNPSFNKLRAMNISVKVQVGPESFKTPVVSRSNPIFSNASTFLFSVSLEETMHGDISFTIYSTATTTNVVGAARIPFVAVKTRYDSTHPSRIIIPITSNEPDIKSVGKGFYCVSRGDDEKKNLVSSDEKGAAGGGEGGGLSVETGGGNDEEDDEDTAFLKNMYKIKRLSKSSLNYDVNKLPKLYVEVTKVDVSGQA